MKYSKAIVPRYTRKYCRWCIKDKAKCCCCPK